MLIEAVILGRQDGMLEDRGDILDADEGSALLAVFADQFAIRTFFEDPAFAGSGWSAQLSFLYNDARDFFGNRSVSFESPLLEQREVTDYAVVAYKRLGATLGTGHDITSASHFALDYHLERISATESLFDVGGNSLIAAQVAARSGEDLDIPVAVRDIFEAPTVAALAAATPRPMWEAPDAPLTADNRLWVYDNQYAGDGASFYEGVPFGHREIFAESWLLRPFVPLEVEVIEARHESRLAQHPFRLRLEVQRTDRKSTRLNSSH